MYSIDKRNIAIRLYSLLESLRKTAVVVDTSHSTISRWLSNPHQKVYSRKDGFTKSKAIVEVIQSAIESNPFISIHQLTTTVQEVLNICVSRELVRTAILKQGITKKKARFYGYPRNEQEVVPNFVQQRNKAITEGRLIVSIDETAFGRNGLTIKGYSKKGQRLLVRKKAPRVTTTSVVACVSKDGLLGKYALVGKAFNRYSFLEFLQSLNLPAGCHVLLDNVSFHHSKEVKEYASTQGFVLLYTPPYCPWFNPIEYCFSVIKRNYYKTQHINQALGSLTPDHCMAFFQKALNCQENPAMFKN
jgi:hypothetical protein